MQTIIVPTDFSTEASYALDVALALARPTGATVVLLHVIQSVYEEQYELKTEIPPEGKKRLEQKIKQAEQHLDTWVKGVSADGVKVHPLVKVGSIFNTVAEIITTTGQDLIVMGTKGDSGLHELLEGSSAEKVVRYAHCPVLTVRKPVQHFQLRNVVFATDFDHRGGQLLDYLTQWQQVFGFKLHIVYVNTPLRFSTTAQLEKRMAKFLKQHPQPNYTTALIDAYSEKEGILGYAAQVQADLLALLTHGRDGLAYLTDGSIAETVVNHADVPVLTYNIHTSK